MLNFTAGGGSFAAWCVDIYSWLNTSSSGASYSLTSGTSFYGGSPIVTALERLASQHLAAIDTVAESGAFQLAVWEIVYENSGSYNLGTGNFQVASASGGAIATANTWLGALGASAPTLALNIWASSRSQDLAVFNVTPIPEPEIYAMLLVGLGLMRVVASRRTQSQAAA